MDALADLPTEIQTGYAHSLYAASLAEFGRPRRLPRCGGWLLERDIPRCAARDAMGLYPLFVCRDWRQLPADIAELSEQIVSLVLVADPFGNHNPALLTRTFNYGVVPFKDHRVIDLSQPIERSVCAHHRRNARKALQRLHVERMASPAAGTRRLVSSLCHAHPPARHRRHPRLFAHGVRQTIGDTGISCFPRRRGRRDGGHAFVVRPRRRGLLPPGSVQRARLRMGRFVRLVLDGARRFAQELRWLDLGADAGLSRDAGSGLSRFRARLGDRHADRLSVPPRRRCRTLCGTVRMPGRRQR